MCRTQGVALSDCFANSFCLSADVTAAYDPNFADVYDKRNSAFVNYGVALCKYTGSGGKGGASDASAEVVGKVRKLMNDNGVFWQMAEMGKTDAGGGQYGRQVHGPAQHRHARCGRARALDARTV